MSDLRKFRVLTAEAGLTLSQLLAERLRILPRQAEALIACGAVQVDSRREIDPAIPVRAGQRIAVRAAQAAIEPVASNVKELKILRQTGDILAVAKPAGMPSQATRWRSSDSLAQLVARLDPSARLAHRLDRDTSGVVLFTRNPAAHRAMSQRMSSGAVERIYLAQVWGHPDRDRDTLTGAIGPDPQDRRRMAVGWGKSATTHYQVVARGQAYGAQISTLRVSIATGRTHQVRVHLAHAGLPVCGDILYGSGGPGPSRLMLHAWKISWPGEPPIEAEIPAEFGQLVGSGP